VPGFTESLVPRTTLTGDRLPPHQPATAEAWRPANWTASMCGSSNASWPTCRFDVAAADRKEGRSVPGRAHDALMALVRGRLGDPKLGRHNGLPVTVIISATLQDLQAKAATGVTGGRRTGADVRCGPDGQPCLPLT